MPGYDPRQMQQIQQMGRMGVGMMGPQPGPYDRNSPQRPPQWWERPMPQAQQQPADAPSARAAFRLLQIGRKTYGGKRESTCAGLRVARGQVVAAQAEDRKCVRDMIGFPVT